MTRSPLAEPLELGETLTQSAVQERFGTNFGYQFKGITYRTPDTGPYLILLANEGAVYDDELSDGPAFTYRGEGLPEKGDQTETVSNAALLDARSEEIPIYLFTSTEGEDRYRYEGLVEVRDAAYVSDGERMFYEFRLRKLQVATWESYTAEHERIEERSTGTPELNRTRASRPRRRVARSSAFRRRVRDLYDDRCTVCGARRYSPTGSPEVEAAHVYPVAEGGPDDLRNALTLCRTHHWAFDHGWFGIRDDHRVFVADPTDRDPPETVARLDGERLVEPTTPGFEPHPTYLAAHREYWGFD
ncbi:HNH endonuclease [Halobaculum sp. MBLA0147]|uniref:HNH endonuclease n=1 Tax=Halobaculum sp. MBLA0147 TaxID=3079934 RepID=UPI003525FFE4